MSPGTRIDLDAYLTRIGVPQADAAGLPTLRRIVAGHARAIAFENLDAFTGRTPRGTSLYRFDLTEQYRADYEVTNWYLANHPESPFVSSLMLARPDADRRFALIGRRLSVYHLDGPAEHRELAGPAAVRDVLTEHFRIDPSGLPDLDRALRRLR